MKRLAFAGAMGAVGVLGLVIAASPTACSSSKSCTPGQSIACTGPGGCSGGQSCNADGTGYGACVCEGIDAAPPPDGSTKDAAGDAASDAAPTAAALHVTWTITQSSNPATCAQVGGVNVDVLLTPSGGDAGSVLELTFACSAGAADFLAIPFGTYSASIALLDKNNLSVATSPVQNVTLASSPCDQIISGDCAKNISAAFAL